MVLGIDEYLSLKEQLINTNFIKFKKYFQRIHKKTGCIYKKWLEEINAQEEHSLDKNNAYFFGHSLSKTDEDVLLEIFNNPRIAVTIFYKDDKHYSDLITNVVLLLGVDKLSEMVYGTNPKIKFVMQSEMIKKSDRNWQIFDDIYKLEHIYQLNHFEIIKLLRHIKEKVDSEDLKYFQSQTNVILLYNSLSNNIPGRNDYKRFLEIAKKLYIDETYKSFDIDSWPIIDFTGYPNFNYKLEPLLNAINQYNTSMQKFTYPLEDLHELKRQIDRSSEIDNDIAERILTGLLFKFKDDSVDTNLLWEVIKILSNKVDSGFWVELYEKLRNIAKDIPSKVYLNHIKYCIDEKYYIERYVENYEDYEDDFS